MVSKLSFDFEIVRNLEESGIESPLKIVIVQFFCGFPSRGSCGSCLCFPVRCFDCTVWLLVANLKLIATCGLVCAFHSMVSIRVVGVPLIMLIRPLFMLCSAAIVLSAISVSAQDETPAKEEAPKLETTKDKASYAIGFNIGRDLKRQGLDLDPKIIAEGIAASIAGKESALTEEQVAEVFGALREEMAAKEAKKGETNLANGKKFLEENKAKEGVKVTKSGLQYLVIKEGDGAVPTKASTVSTHYRGTLVDGTKFDSSYEGKEPAEGDAPVSFGVTQVIKGWTEALQLMKVGSHYRLFIPSELAYGENGPPSIGPNQTLIFEIYLLSSEE